MTQLHLEALDRTYPGPVPVRALRQATLTIEQGDFLAIEGPSGAGKSTLLNQLALLDTPTGGEYFIDGEPTSTLGDSERARARAATFGFVFQSFHLIAHRTSLENVLLGMTYQGAEPAEAYERAEQALKFVGLSHRRDLAVGQLSGGERQRVAIARAISAGAPVLLADEPTGNLDTASSNAIMDVLEALSARGTTVVVVTHNPEVAARASRRIRVVDGEVSESLVSGVLPAGVNAGEFQEATDRRPSRVAPRMMLHDVAQALLAEPSRTLRLVSVVVLAVALTLTMMGLAYSARYQVADTFDASLNRRVGMGISATDASAGAMEEAQRSSSEALARLAGIEGVEEVLAVSSHQDLSVTTDPSLASTSTHLYGMRAGTAVDHLLGVEGAASGFDLQVGLKPGQALIGSGAAESMGLGPLEASPTVWVEGVPFEVVGIIRDAGLRSEMLSAVVVSQEQAAQFSPATEAGVELWVRPGAAQVVGTVSAVAWLPTYAEEVNTVAPPDPQGMRAELEANVRTILLTLTVVSVLVGLLTLSNAMNTAVQAREGELALRRAMGARRGHLRLLIAGESVLVGLVGGLAGSVVGILAVLGVTIAQRWQPVIEPLSIPLGVLLGLITGLVASLIAAGRASKIDPAAVLR